MLPSAKALGDSLFRRLIFGGIGLPLLCARTSAAAHEPAFAGLRRRPAQPDGSVGLAAAELFIHRLTDPDCRGWASDCFS